MNKRVWLAVVAAAVLAGCSSVKLDDVPVEDRKGAAVQPGGTGPGGTQSGVTPVRVEPAGLPGGGPRDVATTVYFDYDSYVIKPQFQGLIEGHARYLKANGGRKVVIEGHTDERGGREYNLALGQRRSEAVRRALGLLGVPDAQVEAVSFGKEKPVAMGSDETAWSQNRRAEIAYR